MDKSYLKLLSQSIQRNWNLPAFTNYQGQTYCYSDLARHIVKVGLLLEAARVDPGDKVALIGRNSAGWAMNFFSILSNGRIAVPILHDFKPSSVHHIINHCGAKALFVSAAIWENLEPSEMKGVEIFINIDDLSILEARNSKLLGIPQLADRLFARKYPSELRFSDIKFHEDQPEELALLSYTSGTSGFSKGVMIPYRALWSNAMFGIDHLKAIQPGSTVVSILPMAHMYGLAFEVYTEVAIGAHIVFISRNPSPRIITEAFQKYKPVLIVAVPLVLEKIIRKRVFPALQSPRIKLLTKIPLVKERVYKQIKEKIIKSLGGNFYEVIIGGAAFNSEVERFLHQIHFPYTTGYGMTECAPLISYVCWEKFRMGSVGRAVDRMQIRIDSPDPEHIVGEIQTRGDNVMLGYYHNEASTKQSFTPDGWLRTGDLGTIDSEGNLFIRGRSKNMLLGPNGQNIYPEEIEDQLNGCPYVAESLVISRDERLIALIHPDLEQMDRDGVTQEQLSDIMQQNITELNQELANYCRLSSFQIYQEEFEKTPKRSIKRYLYH